MDKLIGLDMYISDPYPIHDYPWVNTWFSILRVHLVGGVEK